MNPYLTELKPYPFERLAGLKHGIRPPQDLRPIALSIGEPRHPAPEFITRALCADNEALTRYPLTRGSDSLREAIAQWLCRRFRLPSAAIDPQQQVLPVNGTREALFAFAQCVIDSRRDTLVMMPNPFYQIYEGAAVLAGATPYYLNCTAANDFVPDFDLPAADWARCSLLYLCSPGNPTGTVIDKATLQQLILLADRYDFVIAADECYSEIYPDEQNPPVGLLQAARDMGRDDFARCIVFHSLSKRSNVPGLRSGFVAGDAGLIEAFRLYRTYHGCAMPPATQLASTAAWNDEAHVAENRSLYRQKFDLVYEILQPHTPITRPQAGFYFWLETPEDDEQFSLNLYRQQNLTLLPGTYLSREHNGINPGRGYVRIALTPSLDDCGEAARRIKSYILSMG